MTNNEEMYGLHNQPIDVFVRQRLQELKTPEERAQFLKEFIINANPQHNNGE